MITEMKQILLIVALLTATLMANAQISITDFNQTDTVTRVHHHHYYYDYQNYDYENESEEFDLKGFEPHIRVSFDEGIDLFKNFSFGLDLLAAYRFNEHFRIGAGVGLNYVRLFYEKAEFVGSHYFDEYYESAMSVPIFANIKVNFLKTKVSPYLGFDMGYNVFVPFSKYAESNKLGFFIKPAFGCDIRFDNCALFIELAYRYQKRECSIVPYENASYSQITQCIGFQF